MSVNSILHGLKIVKWLKFVYDFLLDDTCTSPLHYKKSVYRAWERKSIHQLLLSEIKIIRDDNPMPRQLLASLVRNAECTFVSNCFVRHGISLKYCTEEYQPLPWLITTLLHVVSCIGDPQSLLRLSRPPKMHKQWAAEVTHGFLLLPTIRRKLLQCPMCAHVGGAV